MYLGDSVQWNQRRDLFNEDQLVVRTGTGDRLFDVEFRFPDRFLADAAHFDRLVSSLADQAAKPRALGQKTTLPAGLLHRLAITAADRPVVEENFRLMCELNDPIWSYYIRNLARPAWLARPENRVDVLVGNPDLSALFVTRATQQYLIDGGSFAFVMPNAVLDRGYYAGFRAGNYPDSKDPVAITFTDSWDLRRLRPHFFRSTGGPSQAEAKDST